MHTISLNRTCSRCPREERVYLDDEDIAKLAKGHKVANDNALTIAMNGEPVASFEHLCATCRAIVKRYISNAAKKLDKLSSTREAEES